MTKIYTKTGDRGETGLWGGERVPKDHPRVRAYGEVDEVNSAIGVALARLPKDRSFGSLKESLARIQEELFIVGALLATPPAKTKALGEPFSKGLPSGAAARLEKEIDGLTADLEPMKKFILPGGSDAGAALHAARCVCRRAEREIVGMARSTPIPDGIVVYVNRLSDFLFTAARWVNHRLGIPETQWQGLSK